MNQKNEARQLRCADCGTVQSGAARDMLVCWAHHTPSATHEIAASAIRLQRMLALASRNTNRFACLLLMHALRSHHRFCAALVRAVTDYCRWSPCVGWGATACAHNVHTMCAQCSSHTQCAHRARVCAHSVRTVCVCAHSVRTVCGPERT